MTNTESLRKEEKGNLIELIKDVFNMHGIRRKESEYIITYFTPDTATDFVVALSDELATLFESKLNECREDSYSQGVLSEMIKPLTMTEAVELSKDKDAEAERMIKQIREETVWESFKWLQEEKGIINEGTDLTRMFTDPAWYWLAKEYNLKSKSGGKE